MIKSSVQIKAIKIQAEKAVLNGDLQICEGTQKIIIFAHGSGSSRLSPRNQYVAKALNQKGLSTLLFDLLTSEEEAVDEQTAEFRFNIPLLAGRLVAVTDWLLAQTDYAYSQLGYFGASTGAAAALIAAAARPEAVGAVVSRGGRPDLADDALPLVRAPTLFIVGGWDDTVIALNKKAQAEMLCETALEIVPEASHLFEEPGKLDEVVFHAQRWFLEKLRPLRK